MTAVSNPFNDFVFVNATPSDRGSFTLALDKALDKLEKFQLPEPSYFILQWIQALVASGAQRISIELETGTFLGQYELAITFDGPGYTARELQNLYDHVFLSGRDRTLDRLRELSLGWLSASSLKPARLTIQSNGWTRIRDRTTNEAQSGETTTQLEQEGLVLHRLEISGKGSYPFEQMITTHCSDVPVPLTFNGNHVSHPSISTGVPWPNMPFEIGPSRGMMGATYGAGSSTQISFLRHGVCFVARTEPSLLPPVIVRVSDPTLSKNVSQTDVVKDEAYEEFLGRLRSQMKTMGLALTNKRIPSYQRDSLNRYLQAYISSHLDIRALVDPQRLALLGPDYEKLLSFPVFGSNKGVYRSLLELHAVYQQQGSLIYCADPQARTLSWAGVLLVLEPEEVAVLRKFFPNLIGVSLDSLKTQLRQGRSALSPESITNLTLAQVEIICSSRYYKLSLPDCYPTGIAVLRPHSSAYGTALPGLKLTMAIEYLDIEPPNHTDIINLQRGIGTHLGALKTQLETWLNDDTTSFSRTRAAELMCEVLNFELSLIKEDKESSLHRVVDRVRELPLIGLEDGRLVSLRDIESYLSFASYVYVGGVFIEGLESGALDPMPQANQLLYRLYSPHCLLSTERIRSQLQEDSRVRFELRRQVLLYGFSRLPQPQQAFEQFANVAQQQADELARIELEYRSALENPKIFVPPSEERLALVAAFEQDEGGPLLDLSSLALQEPISQTAPSSEASPSEVRQLLPTIDSDKELCRRHDPDLFPERDSLQVERRETSFSWHLATSPGKDGKVYILCENQLEAMDVAQPIRGFLRTTGGGPTAETLLSEGLEQLVIRAAHTFTEGPSSPRLRRAVRDWLFHLCCSSPQRLLDTEKRRDSLFDLPMVPCLGYKFLSWRTLLEQAHRFGETVIYQGAPTSHPCSQREVILWQGPITTELLHTLTFPQIQRYEPTASEPTFEKLYRSTRRDLASVLSGQSTPLLQANLVEQLASDVSLWKRWRSGFLSWDSEQAVVVMNPNHKIGKKLAQRFAQDDSWSRIFASALFSTINRGLEEVEDSHERVFLESLIDTLD